ncbi:hypothetical protein TYRP_018065 [Tyrophagus putrescentiae]|nr:hypothetical protein TYRP_018065 [Tyrophagus putrescentiae]
MLTDHIADGALKVAVLRLVVVRFADRAEALRDGPGALGGQATKRPLANHRQLAGGKGGEELQRGPPPPGEAVLEEVLVAGRELAQQHLLHQRRAGRRLFIFDGDFFGGALLLRRSGGVLAENVRQQHRRLVRRLHQAEPAGAAVAVLQRREPPQRPLHLRQHLLGALLKGGRQAVENGGHVGRPRVNVGEQQRARRLVHVLVEQAELGARVGRQPVWAAAGTAADDGESTRDEQ